MAIAFNTYFTLVVIAIILIGLLVAFILGICLLCRKNTTSTSDLIIDEHDPSRDTENHIP